MNKLMTPFHWFSKLVSSNGTPDVFELGVLLMVLAFIALEVFSVLHSGKFNGVDFTGGSAILMGGKKGADWLNSKRASGT